jgi:CheY-like chemotaxis protein
MGSVLIRRKRAMHLSGTLEYALFTAAGITTALLIMVYFWKVQPARRITVLGLVITVALFAAGMHFIGQAEKDERTRVRSLIEGFAPTYAAELEMLGHHKVTLNTPADDALYLRLIEAEKRWLRVNPGIADIYTFRKTPEGAVVLLVDSETDYDRDGNFNGEREGRTAIGEPYEGASDVVMQAFEGKPGFIDNPYTDRWGTWVSAAVPLHAPDGSVEAVLGVDYPAQSLQQAITSVRHEHMLQGAALVVLAQAATVIIALLRRGLEEKHRAAAELERQKEDLREARDEAQQANHATSEFVSAVSHQLRTPLVSMLNCTEILRDEKLSSLERNTHVQSLHRNGEHLLGMVDDLIDLDNVARGNLQCASAEVDLPALFEEVAAMLSTRFGGKRFSIQYQTAIHRAVRTDAKRLRQALVSLCETASNFGDCESVSLALSLHGPRLRADITAHQVQKDVCVLVEDISKTSVTVRLAGQLVRLVGGTLRTPSNPEQPFRIEIPMNPVAATRMVSERPLVAASAQSATVTGPDLSTLRILVADSTQENQQLLQFLLRGSQLQIVNNGHDAVGKALMADLENKPFDAVILEASMPVLTGLEAASQLRERGYRHPLIALSADASERTRCLAHGFNDFIAKPINRRDLLEVISMQLKRRRAA